MMNDEKIAEATTLTSIAVPSLRIVNLQYEKWMEAKKLFYPLKENSYHWAQGRKILEQLGGSLNDLFGSNHYSAPGKQTPTLLWYIEDIFPQKGWNLKSENDALYNKFIELDSAHKNFVKHFDLSKEQEIKKVLGTYNQIRDFMETGRQVWIWFLQKKFRDGIPDDQLAEFIAPF